MTRIERSIDVSSEPEKVFNVLTDLKRLPDWATTVVDTQDIPGHPLENGDTFRQTVRVAGLTLDSDWRVVELDRPRHVAYEAAAPGGGKLEMKQTVTPQDSGSRIELEIDYTLPYGFLGELADRVYVERDNEQQAERSLQNLQRLLQVGEA